MSIINNCINEKCSNCGECCSDFLPISSKELKIIKDYVKLHDIKECKNQAFLLDKSIDLTCPFRDNINKKCNIYKIRPQICRHFKCNVSEEDSIKYRNKLIAKYGVINLRKEIYNNDQLQLLIDAVENF